MSGAGAGRTPRGGERAARSMWQGQAPGSGCLSTVAWARLCPAGCRLEKLAERSQEPGGQFPALPLTCSLPPVILLSPVPWQHTARGRSDPHPRGQAVSCGPCHPWGTLASKSSPSKEGQRLWLRPDGLGVPQGRRSSSSRCSGFFWGRSVRGPRQACEACVCHMCAPKPRLSCQLHLKSSAFPTAPTMHLGLQTGRYCPVGTPVPGGHRATAWISHLGPPWPRTWTRDHLHPNLSAQQGALGGRVCLACPSPRLRRDEPCFPPLDRLNPSPREQAPAAVMSARP